MGLSKAYPDRPTSRTSDWSVLAFFIGMAFIFWKTDFNFFWRDDWNFLDRMRHFSFAYLFENHVGHVTPLFKLTYYLQLKVFGTNTIFYSYINILFFGLCNYAVFRMARSIMSLTSAWVVAIALTIHPLVFNHLSWIFQQCITQHLLFQVLAVASFLQWSRTGRRSDLYWTVVLTIVQNYFFGNGLFLPLLFVVGTYIFRKEELDRQALWAFILLFLVFVLVQLLLGGTRGQAGLSFQAIPDMITYGLYFVGVNASRAFVLKEGALGTFSPWIFCGLFLALCVVALWRKDRDRKLALFHVIWFVVASCSIPIVKRSGLAEYGFPHYYSILSIIPMAFVIEHSLGARPIWSKLPSSTLRTMATCVIVGVFLIDQQLKDMVSFRHFRNHQQMVKAIVDDTPYIGFDEPYFTEDNFADPDPEYDVTDPVNIYLYWRTRDLFQPTMGYAHALQNWSENAIGPKSGE